MKMRKSYQKKATSVIKRLNRNIKNDDLWLGRFEMRQMSTRFHKYDDNSGGTLTVFVRMIDKATGYYRDNVIEYRGQYSDWKYWEFANKFITEYSNTWKNGMPDAVDYRNVNVPAAALIGEQNWHISEEYWKAN